VWVTILLAIAAWLTAFLAIVNLRVRRGYNRTRSSDQFAGTVAACAALAVIVLTKARWDALLIVMAVGAPGLLFLAGEQAFRGFPRVERRRLLSRRSRP
jgi:peptidoglycan biosynthesis protein MviN/MurJ (putative lipid II flippase)